MSVAIIQGDVVRHALYGTAAEYHIGQLVYVVNHGEWERAKVRAVGRNRVFVAGHWRTCNEVRPWDSRAAVRS